MPVYAEVRRFPEQQECVQQFLVTYPLDVIIIEVVVQPTLAVDVTIHEALSSEHDVPPLTFLKIFLGNKFFSFVIVYV